MIHDVGKLAVPRDLIRKRARLTEDEYAQMQMQMHTHLVEELLADVEFLQPMVRSRRTIINISMGAGTALRTNR